MGLIEERGEGQPKHEGGRGDESPGEKEEPQQRSRQPEFPSWQVIFLISNRSLHGGLLVEGDGWEGCCQVPRLGSTDSAGDQQWVHALGISQCKGSLGKILKEKLIPGKHPVGTVLNANTSGPSMCR